MKNVFSNLSTKAFALLFLVLPAMTSCDKCKDDLPTDRAQLVGQWNVKSFTIDGVEVKGTIITNSTMKFKAYTGKNGDFEWSIQYADGSNETQTGDYEVDEEDKEIDLENEAGERQKFDYDLNGDKMELSGISDGDRVILKVEKD